MQLTDSDVERFMTYVQKTDGCWEWQAVRHPYGTLQVKGKKLYAHRISYELFVEEIPKGMQIHHVCQNKGCVNPDHLELVTRFENITKNDGLLAGWSGDTCMRGHEDWRTRPNGVRYCVTCQRMRQRGEL